VKDRPTHEELAVAGTGPTETLFGLYAGIPLTERSSSYGMVLPDKITLYQQSIEEGCRTKREIQEQIRTTLLHEIGHHFGLSEDELEKAGFHELANFLDFKMPYAGVPHTISRVFRDKNRKVVEDYITAVVEGMQIFRTNKQAAFKAIIELTRQKDPVLLERTYESYAKQYGAIGGLPAPWESGIESMITGFHERFNPQGIKNRDAKPFLDSSFVQRAGERLKLSGK